MSKGSKYKTLMSIRNKDRAVTKTIIGQNHAILFYLLIICTVYKRHFVCIHISFYNENPLSVEMPNQVTCKVKTTDVALKGQTVSSSYKPATLDNGINIQVPPFIESEDEIIIDTRTIKYVKKT